MTTLNVAPTSSRRLPFKQIVWGVLLVAGLVSWPFLRAIGLDSSGIGGSTEAACATTPDAMSEADSSVTLERSRHLQRLGVDRWHLAGHRGRGLKVAILDSGFCGYRAHLGKALPLKVLTRSFRSDGNLEARDSQHGILCGEIVHALAPEAELLFANWEANHPQQFLEAVRWARQQGARVVSCSLIMPTWSDAEGNGRIHTELTRLLGDGSHHEDLLCFACAGNTAERHWSGKFLDAGQGDYHLWRPGCVENPVQPWGNERVSVELCGARGGDFEVLVFDSTTQLLVDRAVARDQERERSAAVRFYPKPGHSYNVRLRRVAGEAGSFHLFVLGGGLRHVTSNGSIAFPGDGPEVVTVGAVDADGRRASYSSCGPNSRSLKPDLVAMVPFVSSWRARPFAGTSAAAPQAAGLAALLWSRHPDWNAQQVRQKLTEAALDLGPRGHDWETGHGLVRLRPLH